MTYQPREVRSPRLAGFSIRLACALLESPGLGALLRGPMVAGVGLERLRNVDVGEASLERTTWPTSGESVERAPGLDEILSWPEPVLGPSNPSVMDYARAYRERRTDPQEIAQRLLDRVPSLEKKAPSSRIFIAMSEEDLLAQARESAERLRQGTPRSLLEGVPVAVKDELDQRPYPSTVGTTFLGRKPVSQDSTVVARLREAGALLVGKTNMHELGIGVTGVNPHYGPTRNPHDRRHVSGGSSGGSAAAVASGICPVAIGADGGGSIRIPAAFCGVYGLKPTFGRVSELGASPLDWSVAHIGPMAGCVRDLAAAYRCVAGPDPADPISLSQPDLRLDQGGIEGLRLGLDPAWFAAADPEIVRACRSVVDEWCARGATLVEVEVPDPDLVRLCHLVIIICEMAAARMADLPRHGVRPAALAPDTRLSLLLAKEIRSDDYIQAQRLRQVLGARVRTLYERVDLLISPSTACTAPFLRDDALASGESDLPLMDRIMRFATPANLLGLPALSMPAGMSETGLPIGIQAMGRPFDEHLLFRLASSLESFIQASRATDRINLLDPDLHA